MVYNFIHATINLKETVYFVSEDDATFPPPRFSSVRSETSEVGYSFAEDHETDGMCMLKRMHSNIRLSSLRQLE